MLHTIEQQIFPVQMKKITTATITITTHNINNNYVGRNNRNIIMIIIILNRATIAMTMI